MVGDPLHDAAALLSLALAQRGDNVPFAPPDDSEKAGRRRSVRLKGEIIAVERRPNAAERASLSASSTVTAGHSNRRSSFLESGTSDQRRSVLSIMSIMSPCPGLTDDSRIYFSEHVLGRREHALTGFRCNLRRGLQQLEIAGSASSRSALFLVQLKDVTLHRLHETIAGGLVRIDAEFLP